MLVDLILIVRNEGRVERVCVCLCVVLVITPMTKNGLCGKSVPRSNVFYAYCVKQYILFLDCIPTHILLHLQR